MSVKIMFLGWEYQRMCVVRKTIGLTKPGQKALMFWIETRPTNKEVGKTHRIVKALNMMLSYIN